MSIDLSKTKDILNELIKTLRDDQESFRAVAEKVQASDLKLMFMDFSTERARFLGEIQNEIERLGEPDPATTGTFAGLLRRGWMNLKTALGSSHDEAIIEECEKAEEAAIERYGQVLKHEMPRYLREMLGHQLEHIGRQRTQISELRKRPAQL